jgi:hypothetical protein
MENGSEHYLQTCSWGQALWHSLHSIAFSYNPDIDKEHYYNFFKYLGYILPCQSCRDNYYKHFNEPDMINALETNESLFRWVYDLHNTVNKITNVPSAKWPSYNDVKEKYYKYKASCEDTCSSDENKIQVNVVEHYENYNNNTMFGLLSCGIILLLLVWWWYKNRKTIHYPHISLKHGKI